MRRAFDMFAKIPRRASASMRRWWPIVAVWAFAAFAGWWAIGIVRHDLTWAGGDIIAELMEGKGGPFTARFEAEAEAANLLSAMRTAVSIRDAGAQDDWSAGTVGYGGVATLRHGSAELPVPDPAEALGLGTDGWAVSFETDTRPLVPLWFDDHRSYDHPTKGRLVFVVGTGNPQTCRRIVHAISGYPSVVANFEAAYPAVRDPVKGDVWFPLDPGRSRVLEEMCASQFEGGDFEAGRYKGGERQKLKFRLAGDAWRSSVSDSVMDIPPP